MKKSLLLGLCMAFTSSGLAETPIESMPNVARLPAEYPASWVFAHDANFNSLIAGKVIIVDIATDAKEYKGAIGAALFGTFMESSTRSELYVGETFFSRGTVGDRSDFITIYDKETLERAAEIPLPGSKRGQFVTNKFAMQLVDDDKYLLVFNFTPASSVTVVGMESRTVLNEIQTPGCSMVYPSGDRGFSSLCGNGSMLAITFDDEGKETGRTAIDPFFNVDDDPVFDKPAFIGSTAYFVSYHANVYAVDMSGDVPKPMQSWSLVNERERSENWRPSGWQVATGDGGTELYVIMSPDGFDGSHKSGGPQIWVADTDARKVLRKIRAAADAFSIEFVAGATPLLAVTNVNMGLDVYERTGELVRSLSLGDAAMPIALHSKR